MQEKITVDFIGIGVPKAATTWLYACLDEHPDICMSSDKETDFFLTEHENKKLAWYEERFKHCPHSKIIGEFSPNYLYDKQAPNRINALYPDAKFIVVLRNPTDRYFSAVSFEYALGRYGNVSFEEALAESNTRNLDRGLYSKHLNRWFETFPKERFHFIFFDEIQSNPINVTKSVFAFLGAEPSFVPNALTKKLNVTVQSPWYIKKIKKAYYELYKALSRIPILSTLVRALYIPKAIRAFLTFISPDNTAETSTKENIPDTVQKNINNYYEEERANLEILLGSIPTAWKQ